MHVESHHSAREHRCRRRGDERRTKSRQEKWASKTNGRCPVKDRAGGWIVGPIKRQLTSRPADQRPSLLVARSGGAAGVYLEDATAFSKSCSRRIVASLGSFRNFGTESYSRSTNNFPRVETAVRTLAISLNTVFWASSNNMATSFRLSTMD